MPADFDPKWVDGHETIQQPPRTGQNGHLKSVVVRYTDEPDQRTVFPADATGVDRTTTWLTANTEAFIDLSNAR